MERTSSANDLTERLRRRLESERREIEELTASELGRLGENSRRVARNALRTIERDTEEATGRMRELLLKAWLRPFVVGLSLWLGIFGGSWATMRWLSRSIQDRIETLAMANGRIEQARETLAELEADTFTRSLKHRDWSRAKRQADEVAAGFAVHEPNGKAEAEPEPLTLGTLFEIYGEEVTPTKSEKTQQRDRMQMRMFLDFLGRDRRPETLSKRDWDRFIRERRAGRLGPSGRPVLNRTIENDLKFLIAVLNWAAKSRDEQGRLLLDSNPLRGLKLPKEKNPTRIVLSDEEYDAMLQVSRRVDWRFHVALVLAHETGHRIGAIRHLRWSDIDFEDRTILWRAEHEKSGYEHRTPVTAEALAALEEAQRRNPGNEDAPVLPASRDASQCMGKSPVRYWWNRAEDVAGLGRKRGRGWHSLRRKFASDLMDLPLKVLCELGGWKEAQTVLRCYQQADTGQLRKALESRPRLRA